ncbi:hypothetical protein [Leptolyngbya sp. NIES-2104]|uniref:hypothetical protein n=1 Tax=Leptolyngbya sp. NIES-2104 TaxID=1552121 RepID=UPI0006ECB6F4|nr:hypothetical protein [Leptolyngbya sp. NIES-2104]GAP94096.1 3-oxoacyl-[acyl-carrier protein] reductase [Leptolyngbya sp. NIES-2104]
MNPKGRFANRREQDVQAFINACAQKQGRIGIAFNDAGIVTPKIARLHDQPTEDFMDSINQ